MAHFPFADRLEAGRILAGELNLRKVTQNAIVLALTRGGVLVGFEAADRLHLRFDIIVARKISVPWQRELSMGAVAGTAVVLDDLVIRELGISPADITEIVGREQERMRQQEEFCRGGEPAFDLHGETAILIDDGLARGNTMLAAIHYARTLNPAKVIVGVPVGSAEACVRLRKDAADLVCLARPRLFFAVGEWYRNFEQVTDEEVRSLLVRSRRQFKALSPS